MGIYDRDYMREDPGPSRGVSIGSILARIGIGVFSLFLIFYCLRFPAPLYIKIPLLIGLAFLIRHLWSLPRRTESNYFLKQGVIAERRKAYDLAIQNYELAAERRPKNIYIWLRLLSSYHSANRITKAQDLIQTLDGTILSERHVEEMEYLVSEYRTATFEKVGSKYRMTLARSGPQK